MNFEVWPAVLAGAADSWDEQAAALDQARSSLNKVDESLLGGRVSGAAAAFLETWRTEVKSRVAQAEGHADALRTSLNGYQVAEDSAIEKLQSLLPWDQRDVEPAPRPVYLPDPYAGGPR